MEIVDPRLNIFSVLLVLQRVALKQGKFAFKRDYYFGMVHHLQFSQTHSFGNWASFHNSL
jgi:hypothetical protein